jgi:hypothetical protein
VHKKWTRSATHLVLWSTDNSRRVPRTTKYALALLAGIWIVTCDWITECIAKHLWADEAPYEVLGDTVATHVENIPMQARTARLQKVSLLRTCLCMIAMLPASSSGWLVGWPNMLLISLSLLVVVLHNL